MAALVPSPAVRLNLSVVNGMARNVPSAESYCGVMPFLLGDAVRLALLFFVPTISLWLVQYVG